MYTTVQKIEIIQEILPLADRMAGYASGLNSMTYDGLMNCRDELRSITVNLLQDLKENRGD